MSLPTRDRCELDHRWRRQCSEDFNGQLARGRRYSQNENRENLQPPKIPDLLAVATKRDRVTIRINCASLRPDLLACYNNINHDEQ